MKGKFVMIDGLDGSGKGVIATTLATYESNKGKRVFDLREHWEEHNTIPEIEEIEGKFDVIISCEPTYAMIGKVIRDEVVRKNKRSYSGLTTAHAFALDREILYKKLLVPAMQKGITIIQERGVISSLVYQPVQLERITLMDIMRLPGNTFALKHAPTLLLITTLDPDAAMKRLQEREKKDNAIFEEILFQRKIAQRYSSEWLKKIFQQNKTRVEYIDTNPPKTVQDTQQRAIELWEEHNKENTLVRHL